MSKKIAKQYNDFSQTYSDNFEAQDEVGNKRFYEMLSTVELDGKKLLDMGCGDGADMLNYEKRGAAASGIDPADEFIAGIQQRSPQFDVQVGKGESLPYKDATFDVVVSKYALQTSTDVPKVFDEIARVLKPGGYFVFLSKHPFRQFMEKTKTYKQDINYFEQQVVDSFIFEGKIHLREPSHTMGEYFSPAVLANFDLLDYLEDYEFPASEQINEYTYPTFFVAKLQRR